MNTRLDHALVPAEPERFDEPLLEILSGADEGVQYLGIAGYFSVLVKGRKLLFGQADHGIAIQESKPHPVEKVYLIGCLHLLEKSHGTVDRTPAGAHLRLVYH